MKLRLSLFLLSAAANKQDFLFKREKYKETISLVSHPKKRKNKEKVRKQDTEKRRG